MLSRPHPDGISDIAQSVRDENLTYLDPAKLELLEACVREVRHVRGDFLETGVALGGSAIVLAGQMGRRRHFHGYDVFAMIPPPGEADPPAVHERYRTIVEGRSDGISGDTYYGYLDDLYDRVVAAFSRHGMQVDGKRITLHRGLFQDTLRPESPVALAHIDCDWYEPVKLCIERIWPQLSEGGLMVFDDYNDYGGCTKAVDEFIASERTATLRATQPTAVLVKS
jgi:asparagine synthase (glutamine-hydrolysing)